MAFHAGADGARAALGSPTVTGLSAYCFARTALLGRDDCDEDRSSAKT